VVSYDCKGKPAFSLDKREGDLTGVLGFGLVDDEAFVSDFVSGSFIGVSRKLDLVGDSGLETFGFDSAPFISGASCRNWDRLFMSSLRGDDGCDTGFSASVCCCAGTFSLGFENVRVSIRSGLGVRSSLVIEAGFVSSDAVVAASPLEGAFLRGPLARPLVMCVSCGPEFGASVLDVEVLLLTVR
jgi:hypothetical protein